MQRLYTNSVNEIKSYCFFPSIMSLTLKNTYFRLTGRTYIQLTILSCDVALAPDATRGKQARHLITLTVRHEVFKSYFIGFLDLPFEICVSSEAIYITYVRNAELFCLHMNCEYHFMYLHWPSSAGALDVMYAVSLQGRCCSATRLLLLKLSTHSNSLQQRIKKKRT